jgi:hypothetical protein
MVCGQCGGTTDGQTVAYPPGYLDKDKEEEKSRTIFSADFSNHLLVCSEQSRDRKWLMFTKERFV